LVKNCKKNSLFPDMSDENIYANGQGPSLYENVDFGASVQKTEL